MYFHKLKGLWDEYDVLEPAVSCVCGAHKLQVENDQKRKLLQFLMGLHESNATIRGQILMMQPLPSVSQAFAFVKRDERSRQGYSSLINAASPFANALVSGPDSSAAAVNKRFGQNKSPNVHKPSIKCAYCNFNGQTKENCYKLIGYPPNWKKKDKPVSNANFRNLPKANLVSAEGNQSQVQSVPSKSSDDSMAQMQQQIAQLNKMMNFFVGMNSTLKSPEDHMAGPEPADSSSLW